MNYLVVAIDSSLSLLRCHKVFTELNYLSLGKRVAKGIVADITRTSAYNYVSVFVPGAPDSLSEFTNSTDTLFASLDAITEDTSIERPTSERLYHSLQWILSELFKCCGEDLPVKIIVVTDGANSPCFANSNVKKKETLDKLLEYQVNITIIFVSLTDDRLSPDLLQLHYHLGPKSVIATPPSSLLDSFEKVTTGIVEKSANSDNIEAFIAQYCDLLLTNYLDIKNASLLITGSHAAVNTTIRCGHLSSTVLLLSMLNHTILENYKDVAQSVHIDVFGFLNISDLSNAPVSSRHCVISVTECTSTEFLPVMLNSMQLTKTVAMVCIHSRESSSPFPDNDSPVSFLNGTLTTMARKPNTTFHGYGFLHQFDSTHTTLLLSVFPKDCTFLPWLGQFKYLAPVADFAGAHLYNDQQGISPFPVRVADPLSYVSLSSKSATDRTQPENPDVFRYVTWLSTSAMATDISKVIRLSRRLPEKSSLFYKELYRVRNAAHAYGCHELLKQILSAMESGFSAPTTATTTLQNHLDSVRQILMPSSSSD